MNEIITYKSYIKDLLHLNGINEDIQVIKYNKERHRDLVLHLYTEIFNNENLDLNWDKVEDFYEKGVFLAKRNDEYIGFIIVYIIKGKIYLSKFGTIDKYKNQGVTRTLIMEVAKHFDSLAYDKIYIEVNNEELHDFFLKIGFKKRI